MIEVTVDRQNVGSNQEDVISQSIHVKLHILHLHRELIYGKLVFGDIVSALASSYSLNTATLISLSHVRCVCVVTVQISSDCPL